jgi:hypothetical protein
LFSLASANGANTTAEALGPATLALTVGTNSATEAAGVLSTATSVGGSGNFVLADGGPFTNAFNVFGSNNLVGAEGPLAQAGAVFTNNQNTPTTAIERFSPGFNINHISFP